MESPKENERSEGGGLADSPPMSESDKRPARSSPTSLSESAEPIEHVVDAQTSEAMMKSEGLLEGGDSHPVENPSSGKASSLSASITSPNPSSSMSSSNGSFNQVILLDWISFCSTETPKSAEILEFAWSTYDIAGRTTLEKSRQLVRPMETDLLSISSDVLQSLKMPDARPLQRAKPLQQVLSEFETTCASVGSPSVCVVVGATKLRDGLLAEIHRKRIGVPNCLRRVLDLATLLVHFYPQVSSLSSAELLQPRLVAAALSLTLPPVGEEFESVDKCAVMSKLIRRMSDDGISLKSGHTSTVVTPESQSASSTSVANFNGSNDATLTTSRTAASGENSGGKSSRRSSRSEPCDSGTLNNSGGAGGGDNGKNGSSSSSDISSGPFAIRLRGVPWVVTAQDVVDFVKPVVLIKTSQVHIVTNYEGKATGEAYVELDSSDIRDQCLRDLHGKHMGRRWIEVFRVSEEDFKAYLNRAAQGQHEKGGAVRLRGLPWSTNEYEVVKFFADGGFPIEVSSVILGNLRDNRHQNGEGWVLLDTPQSAEDARRALHKKMMGRRYIEIFPSTPKEADMARRGHFPLRGGHERSGPYGPTPMMYGGSSMGHYGSSSASSRGVGGLGSGGGGYYGSSSTGSGGGASHHHHHSSNSGSHYGGGGGHGGYGGGGHHGGPSHYGGGGMSEGRGASGTGSFSIVRMRGLPYHANENHIVDFFHGFGMAAILPATAPIDGRPSGEAYVEFMSPDEAWRALKTRNGALIDRRYIELFPSTKEEMDLAAAGMDPKEIRSRCPKVY